LVRPTASQCGSWRCDVGPRQVLWPMCDCMLAVALIACLYSPAIAANIEGGKPLLHLAQADASPSSGEVDGAVWPPPATLPPRELVPVSVYGTSILVPVLRNQCHLDPQHAKDGRLLSFFADGLRDKPNLALLLVAVGCKTLERLRAGQKLGGASVTVYLTLSQERLKETNALLQDRRAFADAFCRNTGTKSQFVELKAKTPKERAIELEERGVPGAAAVLQKSRRACYYGVTGGPPQASGGGGISVVEGWTKVKGQVIGISTTAPTRIGLQRLRVHTSNLIVDMAKANGEE
jgi:hypothetical protein